MNKRKFYRLQSKERRFLVKFQATSSYKSVHMHSKESYNFVSERA